MFWPLTDRLPLCKSGPNTVVFPFLPFDAKRDITNALTELNWLIHSLECPLRCFDDSNPWSDSVPLENDSNGGDSVEEWMRGEGAYLSAAAARPTIRDSCPSSVEANGNDNCLPKQMVSRYYLKEIILKEAAHPTISDSNSNPSSVETNGSEEEDKCLPKQIVSRNYLDSVSWSLALVFVMKQ